MKQHTRMKKNSGPSTKVIQRLGVDALVADHQYTNLNASKLSGTYGTIIPCLYNGKKVVLKQMSDDDDGVPVHVVREIAAYKRLQRQGLCKYILELERVVVFETVFYLVLNRMEGNLKGFLRAKACTVFDAELKKSFKRQLLHGIIWCHKCGIMHRDLKPENILVCNDSWLKIGDFGLAKCFSKCEGRRHSMCAVTLWYRPIEILFGYEYYDEKVDIWSLGCIFYEIDSLRVLFQGDSDIGTLFKICKRFGEPNEWLMPKLKQMKFYNPDICFKLNNDDAIDDYMDACISNMLLYDSCKRPSAEEVLKRL